MFATWLYVSISLLGENADAEITSIRTTAETRNPELGLTGVLIFSGRHFAQFLEGPDVGLETMKSSICSDHRHTGVLTLQTHSSQNRRYAHWALAYSGWATAIDRVLSDSVRENNASELFHYMDELVELIR